MNEPIISPWVFYWVETMDQIRDVVNCVIGVTMLISMIFLLLTLALEKEEREEHISEKIFKRIIKILAIVGVVSAIGFMFIPSKGTVYKMLAASYMTQENIENVGDRIDKIADRLVEKINQVKK